MKKHILFTFFCGLMFSAYIGVAQNSQTHYVDINVGEPDSPNLDEGINTLSLKIKCFLEGVYDVNTNLMSDKLRVLSILPESDPWALSPDIPDAALAVQGNDALVDWVKIQLRDTDDEDEILYETSGLLQRDGDLVNSDGVSVTIDDALPNTFYVVLIHEGHLPAMTPQAISSMNDIAAFDFTVNSQKFGQKEIESGVWGLYAGDATQDYDIIGSDKLIWSGQNGMFNIYSPADFNRDGDVNGLDKIYWQANNGVFSGVPQ